jgi:hypothetical protein
MSGPESELVYLDDIRDLQQFARENNAVLIPHHPVDKDTGESSWDKPILCRIEIGWGPRDFFNLERVTDWEFNVHVHTRRYDD